MAFVLAATVVGCGSDPSGPSSGTPVARVIIVPDSVALPRTQSMRLEAVAVDASGNPLEGREIRWSSSDTVRVKVASGGMIIASDVGWSLVRATSEGKVDSVKVIVTN